MAEVVEIMRFKVHAGVEVGDVVGAGREANGLFDRMPGLQQRVLVGPDAAGTWTEVLLWRDDESAKASVQMAHAEPHEASAYFKLMEPGFTYEKLPVRAELEERTTP